MGQRNRRPLFSRVSTWAVLAMLVTGGAVLAALHAAPQPMLAILRPVLPEMPEPTPPAWQRFAVSAEDTAAAQMLQGPQLLPILVDANRDEVLRVSRPDDELQVYFDWQGDGFAERTGWLAGKGDALLAVDRNGNGRMDGAEELASDVDIASRRPVARRLGLPEPRGGVWVAGEDSNRDGRIDAADPVFSQLMLWFPSATVDFDRRGERLEPVACRGIASIVLDAPPVAQPDPAPDAAEEAVLRRRLVLRWYADPDKPRPRLTRLPTAADCPPPAPRYPLEEGRAEVWSLPTQKWAAWELPVQLATPIPPQIAALPQLANRGTIPSLHRSLMRDAALQPLLDRYLQRVNRFSPAAMADLDAVLYRQAGTDGIDPRANGDFVDARRLAVVERVNERPFWNLYYGRHPPPMASEAMTRAYEIERRRVAMILAVQGPLAAVAPGLRYDTQQERIVGELRLPSLLQNAPQDATAALRFWRDAVALADLQADDDEPPIDGALEAVLKQAAERQPGLPTLAELRQQIRDDL